MSFARDIRPLFRDDDVSGMDWLFDLLRYEDVAARADAILARLEEGTMPCDEPWDDGRVELFRAWVAGGKLP